MVVAICGSVTRQNTWLVVAPSIFAASMSSVGTALMAADRMTIENPVWIQIMMTISQKLLYGVSWTKKTVWPTVSPFGRVWKPPTPPPTMPVYRMKNHPTSTIAMPGTTARAGPYLTSIRARTMKSPMSTAIRKTVTVIVGSPEPVESRPRPIQSAFNTPVCSVETSRAV